MDDGFSFFCGSVPIILIIWRHGGGPIGPLGLLIAGCIGGLASYLVFGPTFAHDGGALSIFLVSFVGGSFVGLLVDAVGGMARGQVAARTAD